MHRTQQSAKAQHSGQRFLSVRTSSIWGRQPVKLCRRRDPGSADLLHAGTAHDDALHAVAFSAHETGCIYCVQDCCPLQAAEPGRGQPRVCVDSRQRCQGGCRRWRMPQVFIRPRPCKSNKLHLTMMLCCPSFLRSCSLRNAAPHSFVKPPG